MEGRKPVLEELEKLQGKLRSDAAIRDEEKLRIQEEMDILQVRWKRLFAKIHDNSKW